VDGADNSNLCILLAVMSINNLNRSVPVSVTDFMDRFTSCIPLLESLRSRLVARGDVQSLQGLAVLSLFYQLSGQ
jgi:hypothetical protein